MKGQYFLVMIVEVRFWAMRSTYKTVMLEVFNGSLALLLWWWTRYFYWTLGHSLSNTFSLLWTTWKVSQVLCFRTKLHDIRVAFTCCHRRPHHEDIRGNEAAEASQHVLCWSWLLTRKCLSDFIEHSRGCWRPVVTDWQKSYLKVQSLKAVWLTSTGLKVLHSFQH